MVLGISFEEIKALASQYANAKIDLSHIDNTTVSVGFDIKLGKVFGHELRKHVVARVQVVRFEDGKLHLTYDVGKGMDLIIAGVQMLFPQFHHVKMVDLPDSGRAIVRLGDIPALTQVMDKATIQGLTFTPASAQIAFTLK